VDNEIKPGDLVVLKSGGPTMTVSKVGKAMGSPTAWVDCFVDKKPMQKAYALAALKKIG
jgi:uncharacterized protein YodC (DUF2158 family)